MNKLFDSQIVTLKDSDMPEQIVELLANQRDLVISKANEMTHKNGRIPFLPVIPRKIYNSLHNLMSTVRYKGKVGYTYLKSTAIIDNVKAPDKPYYIHDVEDGESTRDESFETIIKILKSQKRSPLTMAEVIALTTHTDVLSRHNVFACGSHCNIFADNVPCVWLNRWLKAGTPELSLFPVSKFNAEWGSPSCAFRQ